MKKYFLGIVLITGLFGLGCVGNAPEEIVGSWKTLNTPPYVNPSTYNFMDNGQVLIYNTVTAQLDTGGYEVYASGAHRFVRIDDIQINDGSIPYNGEWYIVKISFEQLVIGTKDYGGFQQRDMVH